MNDKYALYIWSSYGLALAVLIWNLLTPLLRRNELKRHLAQSLDEDAE